ncbi:hypothetical protein A3A76_04595 [Candidatus Woesebacteria bacterium RIFCSPLOWO2_01_FULL_39_23]|uniref:Uncharacterized protein n=1 Tax=Candidatus Woesebacteria bacterium RIFCSPHIGHO2_01_FULL_40_22 TaxID=1802499 RepID=A0A1F7YK51_9BACT|nr:MAG: hypothetical protein A2141_06025 [Candidatus Woesebacteria bacterium RBG_16_40_11]OGM27652.1 MAG: hypothetical protein A2628_04230 [Candidatus Woesebacteria bacterium RIFCSPHIGHO2_01_FULL_40_22]OGM63480.1 MAG: hypothetical protein A3A76_04595 [Candidatus Woesebacteria bacterium RIFCSPLOWO2_01_FULL_39_23]
MIKTSPKKNRGYVNILNVSISSTPKQSLLRAIYLNLVEFDKSEAKSRLLVVTPNPEQIILAQKDREFNTIINIADIALPDGIGIIEAHRYLNLSLPNNSSIKVLYAFLQGIYIGFCTLLNNKWLKENLHVIKGRDFFIDLIKITNKRSWRIYLLGGKNGTAETVQAVLERSYKKVKIKSFSGPILNSAGYPVTETDRQLEEKAVHEIGTFKPHLLFVAFGAPKQEKWLYRHINKLNIGAGMVVGGTFDYIAGKQKVPPKIFDALNLEWLWRLFAGNQNLRRLFISFPLFPWKVFIYKIKSI